MKEYVLAFLKRGLMAAAGGPVILAIVYGCLGSAGEIVSLTPGEAALGILTVTLMAFIAAGISVVYQIERLPLLPASLIHAVVLYLDYLMIYLLNDWIPQNPTGIGVFTAIYAGGYALIWGVILLSIRAKTASLNRQLRRDRP